MMPPIVEHILARKLGLPGRLHANMPFIPGGMQFNFTVLPPFGCYGAIKYAMNIVCVPGVWHFTTEQGGNRYCDQVLTRDMIGLSTPFWVLYTHNSPIEAYLTNLSPLAQSLYSTQFLILITSEMDLKNIQEEIFFLSTKANYQQAAEANRLLSLIATGKEATTPRPPAFGGSS